MSAELRLGVLGAARVVERALLEPARTVPGVHIEAVAARELARAQRFAASHHIARAYGGYPALLADPAIDAVYLALPPALHERWTIRALEAGKHVLCEKPLAVSAAAARRMAEVARARERVLMEAIHIDAASGFARLLARAGAGEVGALQRAEACVRFPFLPMADGDFRTQAALGGGSLLDLGCYAARALGAMSGERAQVISVEHKLYAPEVDRWMAAELRFPSGASGRLECGFRGLYTPKLEMSYLGAAGELSWRLGQVARKQGGRMMVEQVEEGSTYARQLVTFRAAVLDEPGEGARLEQSIAALELLDAIYAAAGLRPRDQLCAAEP